jgi:hypothetical protein
MPITCDEQVQAWIDDTDDFLCQLFQLMRHFANCHGLSPDGWSAFNKLEQFVKIEAYSDEPPTQKLVLEKSLMGLEMKAVYDLALILQKCPECKLSDVRHWIACDKHQGISAVILRLSEQRPKAGPS